MYHCPITARGSRALIDAETEFGNTPLVLASSNGHREAVQLLINAGSDVNRVGKMGSALHAAAEKGDDGVTKLLIEAGAVIDCLNRFNETPLFFAAYDGHVEVVRLLIAAGADPSITNGEGKDCRLAAQGSMNDDIIELVCGKPDAERLEESDSELD